jgi:tetratricopeptide (TPR) repeat protein
MILLDLHVYHGKDYGMAQELLNQGIAAFQAGDRQQAREIFHQVTAEDPHNETAWYYLAAAEDDPALRRVYLERVLAINPQHERAREVLQRLNAESAPPPPPRAGSSEPRGTPIRPLSGDGAAIPGEATTGGFVMPLSIPGAPARVGIVEMIKDGWSIFMRGVEALQRKPGAYEGEVSKASWWRFWFFAGWVFVISAILNFIGLVRFNVVAALLGLVIFPLIQLAVLYAGVFVSYWWVSKDGGTRVPRYQHAYLIVLPYLSASLAGTLISTVLSLIGLGLIGSLVAFALNIYALYLIALGFDSLHQFQDSNQKWITLAMFIVGSFIAGFVLAIVVGAIGLSVALPFGVPLR